MTINHLNLVVTDVAKAVSFFETYFRFNCTSIKGDNIIAILKNEENFTLVLMTDKAGVVTYPKDFHIGFMFETSEDVDRLYQELTQSDVGPLPAPKKIRDSYGFYFHFDNILIEVGLAFK